MRKDIENGVQAAARTQCITRTDAPAADAWFSVCPRKAAR